MEQPPNGRLRLWMALTLVLLGTTGFAATVLTGMGLTLVSGLVLLIAGVDIGVVGEAVPVLIAVWSMTVLLLVVWGERDAPAYTVAALGAQRVAETANPELVSTVRRLAQQADLPTPTVYIAPTETPISLVTGFRQADARLVLSRGLLDVLDEAEQRAVIAHELAHVKNDDAAVMTAAALPVGAAERVRDLLSGPTAGIEHGVVSRADYVDATLMVGYILVAPLWLLSSLLSASFARTREFAADRGAVAITGEPAALATALERIDDGVGNQPSTDFRRPSVAAFAIVEPHAERQHGFFGPLYEIKHRLFATHPPTETRIRRLEDAQQAQRTTRSE
jgi:heat shock protein HtpX